MGEEEGLDDDPVIEEDSGCNLHRPEPSVDGADLTGDVPGSNVGGGNDFIALDLQQDNEMEPVAFENAELPRAEEVVEDAVAAASHPMPPLARNCQPGRRHGQHEKSFSCGVFFIKYRDDRSELYPDRIPSWTVTCPVHEDNCARA